MSAEAERHPYRWVACSITEFGHVGAQRHLARTGQLTTYCGHTASLPGIWRANTRKPKCPTCADAEDRLLGGSITCPVCGRTSHHPTDVREGYCSNCSDWTSPPASERSTR